MDIAALLAKAMEWGPTAMMTIVAFFLIQLYRKIDKNGEADKNRNDALVLSITKQIDDLKEESKEQLEKSEEHLKACEDRIAALEADTLPKDDFYRENAGWRAEINRLSDQITTQLLEFTRQVISLWKEKKQ